MRKIFTTIVIAIFSFATFAQTTVSEKKLGKTLEKNKDSSAVFVSEIDLGQMTVSDSGTVTLPLFAKNKISVVSEMDMTNLRERISFANKTKFTTTFKTKDLDSKIYAITKIDGIETVTQYKERLAAEEKRRAEEEKARWERERVSNITKLPVQVVNQEVINLAGAESAWLPGQIQDKLKSNLQEFLGMKTVVDSKTEEALKKLQAESESASRDEAGAIELGKITTAKFALFTKLRKTGKGYTLSADFTDLTTGEQMASVTSKEYSSSEYLYGSTGAVDEITLALGNKLGIPISDLSKNLLASGSASFSVDEQLALAKQNEETFLKMMAQYDSDLARLNVSNDLSAIENKKKIEAEKALLVEKQKAEKKRQAELTAQKQRAEQDAKLEAERSIALKTQRDEMAKQAAAKAAEVRKLKMEKQGVLGQINVIESKKKALVEIRQSVESRSQELYDQLVKDREAEEARIRNKSYSTVELGSNGQPTEAAKTRREKQVIKSYEDLANKFFADADAVKKSTAAQDTALLAEIRADQKALSTTRTVSSMGEELKVSFGTYEGSKNGWNAYLSLYSDGVLLYTDDFIVSYEALSGKKAPDMATELRDSVIEEYTNNVDMYNSLLTRGDPIIYFEIDYNVTAEADDKPSEYKFNFNKIRVINTVSGKATQTSTLSKVQPRAMKPEVDLREYAGIVAREKEVFAILKMYFTKGLTLSTANQKLERDLKVKKFFGNSKMILISNQNFEILNTEITQSQYIEINGANPSTFVGTNNPVESVTWEEAICFCNKLSERFGYQPVYKVDLKKLKLRKVEADVDTDTLILEYGPSFVIQNDGADGFRLPTLDEWEFAARGGKNYRYAGSNNLDEVAWYKGNSGEKTHPVSQKRPNEFGLYDMNGNVAEWVWNFDHVMGPKSRHTCGGSIYEDSLNINAQYLGDRNGSERVGFRIVRNVK